MNKLLMTALLISLFTGCAQSEGDITEEEQRIRDKNGMNLFLVETEKGDYSGSHRFSPFYSYDYNKRNESKSLSVFANILFGYNYSVHPHMKNSSKVESFALLSLLYYYFDAEVAMSPLTPLNSIKEHWSFYGPAGILWISTEDETEEEDYLLWGLVWKRTDNYQENIKQVTPLFKYVKDYENKKKIFRLLWFIDIPLGDMDEEVKDRKAQFSIRKGLGE